MSDTPNEKRKIGRPTKYKPEYCQQLIEHMSEGFSFESFAANVGTSRDVLYDWAKANIDFADAKKQGHDLSLKWWEGVIRAGVCGKIKGFSAAMAIFAMKNKHGWRDVQEIEQHSTQKLEILIDDKRAENYAL